MSYTIRRPKWVPRQPSSPGRRRVAVTLTAGAVTINATTGTATAAGVDAAFSVRHDATVGTATAAALNATGVLNPTASVGTATAAGVNPTVSVVHTATVGTATAAGLPAAGGIAVTATVGTATAAGVNAAGLVVHTATVGTATAAGLTAAGGIAVTATVATATATGVGAAFSNSTTGTVGTATAAGKSATFSVNHTATVGTATAAAVSGTFSVRHDATTGTATAAGQDATFSSSGGGPASPNNGLPVRVTGVVRLTRVAPVTALTEWVNLVSNTGADTNLTNIFANGTGTVVTRDTTVAFDGAASAKVVTNGVAEDGVTYGNTNAATGVDVGVGATVTGFAMIKATVGTHFYIGISERDPTTGAALRETSGYQTTSGAKLTADGTWQLIYFTWTIGSDTNYVRLKVKTADASVMTFWSDMAGVVVGTYSGPAFAPTTLRTGGATTRTSRTVSPVRTTNGVLTRRTSSGTIITRTTTKSGPTRRTTKTGPARSTGVRS